MRGVRLVAGLAAAGFLAAGCSQTVAGSAQKPDGNSSSAAELAGFLLAPAEVDAVVGSTGIEVTDSAEQPGELADSMSDQRCAATMYNAEKTVYQDTGWTALADQVLTEPGDQSRFWVEQTVVQLPSAQRALDFFNSSVQNWTNCIGTQVTVTNGDDEIDWRFEGIGISGTTMTQTVRRSGGDPWGCQHAFAAAGSRIVEVSVCTAEPAGEAVLMANQIIAGMA